jgi:hypothetical protein
LSILLNRLDLSATLMRLPFAQLNLSVVDNLTERTNRGELKSMLLAQFESPLDVY